MPDSFKQPMTAALHVQKSLSIQLLLFSTGFDLQFQTLDKWLPPSWPYVISKQGLHPQRHRVWAQGIALHRVLHKSHRHAISCALAACMQSLCSMYTIHVDVASMQYGCSYTSENKHAQAVPQ